MKNQQLVATKAVDEVDGVTNMNDPYNIAKQGGKHSGFYDEYSKKPDSQIQKGIESINKQISEHQNKIEDPKKSIAFLIHKRYIPDPEQLNQQRFKCAAQMREPLYT